MANSLTYIFFNFQQVATCHHLVGEDQLSDRPTPLHLQALQEMKVQNL
jgi:hypothetical protein